MKRYFIIVFCCFCKTVIAQSDFQYWEREALAKSASWSYYTRAATAPNYPTYTSLYINGRPVASFSDAGTCRSKITELKRLAEQMYKRNASPASPQPSQWTYDMAKTLGKSKAEVDAEYKKIVEAVREGSASSNAKKSQELIAKVEGTCSCRTVQNPNYDPKTKPYDNNNDLFATTDGSKNDMDNQSDSLLGASTQYENIFDAPSARNTTTNTQTIQPSVSLNFDDMEKYASGVVSDADKKIAETDIKKIIENCVNAPSFCDCVQSNFTSLTGKYLDGKNSQIKSETDIANNRLFNEYLRNVSEQLDAYTEKQKEAIDTEIKNVESKFRTENAEKAKMIDMAKMAQYSYSDSELPEGWNPVTDNNLLNDFNSNSVNDGFYAAIYQKDDEYVVSFRGSENPFKDPLDWVTNASQAMGSDLFRTQYSKAILLIESLKAKHKVSITGHSLGGGLASAAGLATGLPTYTFNAAGVHPNTIEQYKNKSQDNIHAYYSNDDPLNQLQDKRYADFLADNSTLAATSVLVIGALQTPPGQALKMVGQYAGIVSGTPEGAVAAEALNNPIATLASLSPALGNNRVNLGDTGGHGIGGIIDNLETPLNKEKAKLEEAKSQIDLQKDNLKMTLSNCAASE